MGRFTVIPQDTFKTLQLEAGVLLNKFDPASDLPPADEDIICATSGGIKADCIPTYSDLGADVDNCPVNMKELVHLDSWTCTLGFTALTISVPFIKMALSAADADAENPGKVTPRRDVSQDDFRDVWWAGDLADGGWAAIRLMNALSTGGFSLQTTKSGRGQVTVTLTGYVSIDAQKVVPMEFYVGGAAAADEEETAQ